jgi:hypothetical protein
MVEIDYLSIFWYLVEEKLLHIHYKAYDETWDHDHCAFCSYLIEDKSQLFYCTEDEYYWVCEECFNEFKDMFKWQVLDEGINTSAAALETDGE